MKLNNILQLTETDSTNLYLKKLIDNGKKLDDGLIVITNKQTKGKGQASNIWESEAGMNLTFSILLKPTTIPAELMFSISKIISLGLISYLETLGEGFSIKWPNDIYHYNKKLGGILIENQIMGSFISNSISGIGINVNQENFISDAPNPISLKQIYQREFNLDECLTGIQIQIERWYKKLINKKTNEIDSAYFEHLFRKDGFHPFKEGNTIYNAKIKAVDKDGQLHLITKNSEEKSFYFKEIEFIIPSNE